MTCPAGTVCELDADDWPLPNRGGRCVGQSCDAVNGPACPGTLVCNDDTKKCARCASPLVAYTCLPCLPTCENPVPVCTADCVSGCGMKCPSAAAPYVSGSQCLTSGQCDALFPQDPLPSMEGSCASYLTRKKCNEHNKHHLQMQRRKRRGNSGKNKKNKKKKKKTTTKSKKATACVWLPHVNNGTCAAAST